MGQVFGYNGVAEPAYKVLTKTAFYEVRKYGRRFAAETPQQQGSDSAFMTLARYIGVFGEPQNESRKSIDMTAPVSMKQSAESISMTAPVAMKEGSMMFILPESYQSLDDIPKPINNNVHIKELPAQVGAVHRFSGSMDMKKSHTVAQELGEHLQASGVQLSEERINDYEYWGYNPPFTLPMFRRNEVFIELRSEEVDVLVNGEKTVKN